MVTPHRTESATGGRAHERALPRYLAPLPRWLEELALRHVWLLVAVNLAGTAFGFYYYLPQFGIEPVAIWPLVPDSPTATLFIALSLAAWRLGRSSAYLDALAFFGCLKLGLWTPFVLLAFAPDFGYLHWAMYNFLLWSHLGMVAQGFLVQRYGRFTVGGIVVAVGWYALNDLVDYFVPVIGDPHHTLLPSEYVAPLVYDHAHPSHDLAAAAAVLLTLLATVLAFATLAKTLERHADGA